MRYSFEHLTRREFLKQASVAGTAAFLAAQRDSLAAEPPLETTKLRLAQSGGICTAPQYVAEQFLRGEGFTDVQYIKTGGGMESAKGIGSGEVNIGITFVGNSLVQIAAGEPILFLAGLHIGCYELFGNDRVRSIRELKGKKVAVSFIGGGRHLFLASMAIHVGLDPHSDIQWITDPPRVAMRMFADGEIDAIMGFPPEPQELRAKKIGHVVVNTTLDRPWSQYFCCMVIGNREFVRKHPIATKRALRAILKGNQICSVDPERAARLLVDKGYTNQYEYALQSLKEIPYGRWREYDPEDTVRFYSLRL